MSSNACSRPFEELERLVDDALHAVLVGTCDAHGRDYSILYTDGSVGLAPLYDLVSTTLRPDLDTTHSMRFGRTYRSPDPGPDDLAGLAEGLSVARRAAHRRLDRLRENGPEAWDRVLDLPELSSETPMIESVRAG
ncbi:MAG: HipA domain-containing protein [Spirochaetota bacterium]